MNCYSAPWWGYNPHFQIALTFLIPQARVAYRREILIMKDTGQVTLDWLEETEEMLPPCKPIMIALHGLTGGSDDLRSFCLVARSFGFRPVVFNKRGHAGTSLSTAKLQTFGDPSDLEEVLREIEARYPQADKVAVGFSAGSGLLASYLGKVGNASLLKAGVGISPGYDAFKLFCADTIDPVYNTLMTHSLKRLLRQHQGMLGKIIDYGQLNQAVKIHQIDTLAYMKFENAETIHEYWLANNPMRQVENIQVPMLCINALDDPICTKEMIPYDLFQDHDSVMLKVTSYGSHCAFFDKGFTSWAHQAAIEFLQVVLAYRKNLQRMEYAT